MKRDISGQKGRGGVKGERRWDCHIKDAEMENVLFLIGPDGGMMRLADACARVGVGFDGMEKRLADYRKREGKQ